MLTSGAADKAADGVCVRGANSREGIARCTARLKRARGSLTGCLGAL
jgi:hypothetical protein